MNETLSRPKPSWIARLLNPYVAIPLTLVFLLLCSPLAYRGYKLSLVPDPGEPFDVAAFIKSSEVDDADNALNDFKLAISLLTSPLSNADWDHFHDEVFTEQDLSPEAQKFIEYLKLNEPAILAWRKGTTKPQYCEIPMDEYSYTSLLHVSQEARNFVRLLSVQSLLEYQNENYEQAATLSLASFRTAQLVQQNGGVIHRLISFAAHNQSVEYLRVQIQDQQFPEEVLERLLQELTEIHNTFAPLSRSFKAEYWACQKIGGSDFPDFIPDLTMRLPVKLPPSLAVTYLYVTGDPELSNKLTRQWFGNLLPEVDRPRYQRSRYISPPGTILLFHPSTKKPGNRRQLSPAEIDEVWKQALLFKLLSPALNHFMDAEDKYQNRRHLLTSTLRLEIYRRQHGRYPDTLELAFPDGKVPPDVFDLKGAPLRYAKDADHACRIWSIGLDGKDDGGLNLDFAPSHTDYGFHLKKKTKPTSPE